MEGAAQDDAESLRMQRGAGDPGDLEPVSLSLLGGGRRGLASIDGAIRRGDAAVVQSKENWVYWWEVSLRRRQQLAR